jgi:hypothetical protein
MPGFEALYVFLVVASLLLGGASAILFLLRWRKTAKAFLVLAGLAVALTVMTYFSIWGFTRFGSEFQNSHLPACAVL